MAARWPPGPEPITRRSSSTAGTVSHHVRFALGKASRHARGCSSARRPDRGRHQQGHARDPPRAARGRRQLQGRQAVHELGQGARARDRDHQAAQPGPAGHQDRQRRADRADGRPVGGDHVLAAPADRDPDGRPAGLRQDHRHGQAGEAAQGAERLVRGRRRLRRLPPGRRRAADQGRRPGGRDGLRAGHRQGPGGDRRVGARPGQEGRQGRPDRRYERSPARRRGAHAGAREHQEAREAARRAPGGRRHDRPGRGQRGRAVRGGRAVRRRDPLASSTAMRAAAPR